MLRSLRIEYHLSVGMFQVFLFLQESKPIDPEDYAVFEDVLLIGQVCFKRSYYEII